MVSDDSGAAFDPRSAAAKFVSARRSAGSFQEYPGVPPRDLDTAYLCQDEAIALWDDAIAGWKVGWIPFPLDAQFGAQRLVGPIFQRSLKRANGAGVMDAAVFGQGFAAVEAEFVFQLADDAPAHILDWSAESAQRLVARMFVGIEIASSPLQNINDFGPAVVISDFGNNAGLLLGPEIPDWQRKDLASLTCETRIDGVLVGRGSAASVSGGPLSALAFALRCNARRERPLRAGEFVSTGAVTGVHTIALGQSAMASFAGIGTLQCVAVAMTPVS